jgi:hypothetical protein
MGDILRKEARMIAVTGSTGNVGGPLIGELAALGEIPLPTYTCYGTKPIG